MSKLQDVVKALLGVSAYQQAPSAAASVNDADVERIRESVGGQISSQPQTVLRWYLRDLETAQLSADSGNITRCAQLYRSMRRDGVISGLLRTLTSGLVRLPKRFYGDENLCKALAARNGTRPVFDDMFPPQELALLAADGHVLGIGVAELVPVPGRDFPVLVRLEPEYLSFRWNENRWYYRSVAGDLPIVPGDGRWVLHSPGGRVSPWTSGLWLPLGRSYINKEHALLHRSNYSGKLANPARVAKSALGATEAQRTGFLASLIAWGINTVFELPPGWDVALLESNGRGYEVFKDEILTCDNEIMISLAGQVVTTTGGVGFTNANIFQTIRGDIIQDVAEALAFTLNTQGLPAYNVTHGGDVLTGAMVEWDIRQPKDQQAEATVLQTLSTAVPALAQALAAGGLALDYREIVARNGIPIAGEIIPVTDAENTDGKAGV